MKTLLLLIGLMAWSNAVLMASPSWREVQRAVDANDMNRLEAWVKQDGIESLTALHALIAAAEAGNRIIVDKLLALGISLNRATEYGVTPLLKAADNGCTEMVHHLLQRGAKANIVGRCEEAGCKGHTPLMGAACNWDVEMAGLLLKAGADPRLADDSATQTAHENGDVELYLLLRHFGGRERLTNSPSASAIADGTIPLAGLGLTELLPGKIQPPVVRAGKSKSRLSIIADDPNVVLGDLLTSILSTDPSLELIERQELDRVLSEQKLTRHFASDAANYARVSGLLRADALLLIQAREVAGRKVVESRLLRVNPGLVLDTLYAAAPIAAPAEWARRLGAHVSALTTRVTQQGAIALSLLNIRSSVTSSADRALDRTIAVMLSDRLAHQPPFLLLERTAMERMASESSGRFWTGSYLVDGSIEPALDGSGAFRLSVRFRPPGRGEAFTFNSAGRRSHPAQAVDDLLLQINSRLTQLPPPERRDLADEAQRYFEEADWALATKQGVMAQSASEAAWALGSRSLEVARLRVLAALLAVRDARPEPAGQHDNLGPPEWLDLVQHGMDVWRETLEGEALRGKPEEVRKWLDFGLESIDGALFAAFQIRTAGEQVRHATRLERLRQSCWETLEKIRQQSKAWPNGESFDNRASEKQAVLARFTFPRTSELVPAARDLLSRRFSTNNLLTRARIRATLCQTWDTVVVPFRHSLTSFGTLNFPLSRGDDARRQLAESIRGSSFPEDRYVSAVLALKRAALRRATTSEAIDRVCGSLFELRDLLSEGGELFTHYFDIFDALDKSKGVPFFAVTWHENGKRGWERHTPEHSRFRGKLFVAIAAKAKKADPQFTRMINRDEFTPEQEKEIAAARLSLERLVPVSRSMAGSPRMRMARNADVSLDPTDAPSTVGVPALRVTRLWHPFNLELGIPGEFRADFPSLRWAENRIWIHGSTINEGGQSERHFIFAINAATMSTETFSLPEPASTPDARFLITHSHLIVSLRDFIAVLDRPQARWEVYQEIKPAGLSEPLLVHDRIYLPVAELSGSALISLDLKARTTEVLTSSKRRPAVSPFDNPSLPLGAITTNDLNEIVVSSGKVSHVWSPTHRTWRAPQTVVPNSNRAKPGQGRVGLVKRVDNRLVLRLSRKDAPAIDVPLAFAPPGGIHLPESRYGQNIWPTHCNSFEEGLLLISSFIASGFWVIPKAEIDEYLRQRAAEMAQSAAN
jgi:hypothetical protein